MKDTYEEVIHIIAEILEKDTNEINKEANLFDDLNMDSLTVLELINQIEEKWEITLTEYPELLDKIETVESLADFLANDIGVVK